MIRGLNKISDASGLGYLISSYTAHPGGAEGARSDAQGIAAALTLTGLVVFAPIAYGPQLEELILRDADPEDHAYLRSHEFWMPICERLYTRCDYGIVATTPGWQRSKGIAIEIYALARNNTPLYLYDTNAQRILTFSEADNALSDELTALLELSAEVSSPGYLTELAEARSEGIAAGISHFKLAKLLGDDDGK